MKTDFKFRRIVDGNKTTAVISIYEGDITTEKEKNINGEEVDVTRYRRIAKLRDVILSSDDVVGKDTLTFNELKNLGKTELSRDSTRTPIDKQK